MSTVLISFLGRSKKEEGNYRTTVYSLEGKQQPPTAYVGYLLREYYKPKKNGGIRYCRQYVGQFV